MPAINRSMSSSTVRAIGGMGGLLVAGIDCAGQMQHAREATADGDRDPKTGECQTISSGLELKAVPAFVQASIQTKEEIASR